MSYPFFRRRSQLPYFLEFIASVLARTLYRVRTSGVEHFPQSGGVLLIGRPPSSRIGSEPWPASCKRFSIEP